MGDIDPVKEFNDLADVFLAKLPESIPKLSIEIKSASVRFRLAIEKQPTYCIGHFAKYLDAEELREGKEDFDAFILNHAKETLNIDFKEVWSCISPKTKESIKGYMKLLLGYTRQYWQSVPPERLVMEVNSSYERVNEALRTNDFSKLSPLEKKQVDNMQEILKQTEDKLGVPFDQQKPEHQQEFVARLSQFFSVTPK